MFAALSCTGWFCPVRVVNLKTLFFVPQRVVLNKVIFTNYEGVVLYIVLAQREMEKRRSPLV
jgi:hypothetical protein